MSSYGLDGFSFTVQQLLFCFVLVVVNSEHAGSCNKGDFRHSEMKETIDSISPKVR